MTEEIVQRQTFDVSPRNFTEAIELCKILSESTCVPEAYRGKPGDIFIAIQYGAELGIKPLQSLQGIYIVNGRPAVFGDLGLAIVLRSGLVEEFREMTYAEIEAAGKAVFWIKRKGKPEPIERAFSIEDAKRAGLWGKTSRDGKPSPWVTSPWRMLQWRARWLGLRDGFADALKGMAAYEEVIDIPAAEDGARSEMFESLGALRTKLRSSPAPSPGASAASDSHELGADSQGVPNCPKCGAAMKLQPAGTKKDGTPYSQFWSCSAFPKCKGSRRAGEESAAPKESPHATTQPSEGPVAEPAENIAGDRLTKEEWAAFYNKLRGFGLNGNQIAELIGRHGYERGTEIPKASISAIESEAKARVKP